MSRKELRESAREARREAVRLRQQRAARRRRAVIAGASTAAVALVAAGSWALVAGAAKGPPRRARSPSLACGPTRGWPATVVSGPVLYPQMPPVGGKHAAIWQNCGVYNVPITNENVVYSLEHGAMWITYRPGLAASEITAITADVSGQPYGLVSP